MKKLLQVITSIFVGGLVGAGIPLFLVILYLIGEVAFNDYVENNRRPQAYFILAGGVIGLVAAVAAIIKSGTISKKVLAGTMATIALWVLANLAFAYYAIQSGENLALPGAIAFFIITIPSWALGAIAAYAAARIWERMSR